MLSRQPRGCRTCSGDRVADVDGRHLELAEGQHAHEGVHARGGLLADALHVLEQVLVAVRVHQAGEVTTVVEDHVGALAVGPLDGALDAPVVFGLALALPGDDRDAGRRDGCGRVVLGAEDVARAPAHLRAQLDERLDEHRGLDGHVQAAGDARALERLRLAVLGAQRHQARHLLLGQVDLLAAPLGQRHVLDLDVGLAGGRLLLHSGLHRHGGKLLGVSSEPPVGGRA